MDINKYSPDGMISARRYVNRLDLVSETVYHHWILLLLTDVNSHAINAIGEGDYAVIGLGIVNGIKISVYEFYYCWLTHRRGGRVSFSAYFLPTTDSQLTLD